jgi:hypothetical protein
MIPTLGAPVKVNEINHTNCKSMHDVLMPLTIRAVAGLMYWYACQTNQLQKVNSNENMPDISSILYNVLND